MTSAGIGELLHAVRELLLDRVGDEPGQRVLADDADQVGQLARRVVGGAAPADQRRARRAARR